MHRTEHEFKQSIEYSFLLKQNKGTPVSIPDYQVKFVISDMTECLDQFMPKNVNKKGLSHD
jgi:hypothetical protein